MSEQAVDNPTRAQPGWSQIWQVPVLILGLILFVFALLMILPGKQVNQIPDVLDEVTIQLKANRLDEAKRQLQVINEHLALATPAEQGRHWLLWGDLVYLQQRLQGMNSSQNDQLVVDYYHQAEALGQSLNDPRRRRLAETLVRLDQVDQAMAVLDQIKDAPESRRYLVIKELIERKSRQPEARLEEISPLLTRFHEELRGETVAATRRREQLWATALEARKLIEAGNPQRGIDFLNLRWIRFKADGGDEDLAPLSVLLGKAYQRIGEHEEARRWFLWTQRRSLPADPLNADVLVGLGQLDLSDSGDIQAVRSALEYFSKAESEYPATDAYLEGLIGRAECEARLELHPESIEHFGRAVELLVRQNQPADPRRKLLTDIVRAQYDLNMDREEYDRSLDYLSLVAPLHGDQWPSELLVRFAVTHERLAEQLLAAADSIKDADGAIHRLSAAELETRRAGRQQAAVHFGKAAEFFARHAQTVISDVDQYGASLWQAAVCYDKANLWRESIDAYVQYVKTLPQDSRQLEATFRLGLAYQADKQYRVAAEVFQRLIHERPNELMAYHSFVPLAKCLMALGEFGEAERVLQSVLNGHPGIRPDSQAFRDALIELGKLLYQRERFSEAIVRFAEAADPDRYGQTDAGAMLRFYLADSYRRSVEQLDSKLREVLPQTTAQALRAQRAEHLTKALDIYGQVISQLEARTWDTLSPTEQLYLRNAYFYRGDCAYDLGNWRGAIDLYDQAAKRWEHDPASLVALVQIVNAHCELGEIQAAKIINDKANWHLKRIPDDAFSDPNLPMTREHWQDWLRWTSELDLFNPQANASKP